MKILSWNINGIRAMHKKGALADLWVPAYDVLCFQEVKAERDQLDEALHSPPGYHAYFSHSKGRKGYSGVAIYSRIEPIEVVAGMDGDEDPEGRMLTAFFADESGESKGLALINCYFPNGGRGEERMVYKLDFYKRFLNYCNRLRDDGYQVIFCGDVNTAHTEIDLARPRENIERTGFLPIERAWIDDVIANNYVDVFRNLHPDARDAYTYWDVITRARERNVGWRIDYFFASSEVMPRIRNCSILADIMGSDHCPVLLDLRWE